MTLKFNPRISGAFTDYVLGDNTVKGIAAKMFPDATSEQLHNFAKAVLIKGFNCFDVDINNVINAAKDSVD